MTELETVLGFTAEDKARWMDANAIYYDDPEYGWSAKLAMHANRPRSAAVYVMPSYQSPVTGKWVDSPSQRRDDLKRTGSRPWEGMADEKANVSRQREYDSVANDKALEHTIRETLQYMPDSKKAELDSLRSM